MRLIIGLSRNLYWLIEKNPFERVSSRSVDVGAVQLMKKELSHPILLASAKEIHRDIFSHYFNEVLLRAKHCRYVKRIMKPPIEVSNPSSIDRATRFSLFARAAYLEDLEVIVVSEKTCTLASIRPR